MVGKPEFYTPGHVPSHMTRLDKKVDYITTSFIKEKKSRSPAARIKPANCESDKSLSFIQIQNEMFAFLYFPRGVAQFSDFEFWGHFAAILNSLISRN